MLNIRDLFSRRARTVTDKRIITPEFDAEVRKHFALLAHQVLPAAIAEATPNEKNMTVVEMPYPAFMAEHPDFEKFLDTLMRIHKFDRRIRCGAGIVNRKKYYDDEDELDDATGIPFTRVPGYPIIRFHRNDVDYILSQLAKTSVIQKAMKPERKPLGERLMNRLIAPFFRPLTHL